MPTSAPMPLNSPERSSSASPYWLRRQVAGVRVLEAVLDHAAHRAVDELLVGDLVDVLGLDLRVGLAQHGEGLDGSAHVIVSRIGRRRRASRRRTAPRRSRVAADGIGLRRRPPDPPMARPATKVRAPKRRSDADEGRPRHGERRRRIGEAVIGGILAADRRAERAFCRESPRADALERRASPADGAQPQEDRDLGAGARVAARGLPRPAVRRQVGDLEHRIGREARRRRGR